MDVQLNHSNPLWLMAQDEPGSANADSVSVEREPNGSLSSFNEILPALVDYQLHRLVQARPFRD
jgi:hypothetical protein